MKMRVDESPRQAAPGVPPPGWHSGVLEQVLDEMEDQPGPWIAVRFRAERQLWRMTQKVDPDLLHDLLHSLGNAGKEVDTRFLRDIRVEIRVQTRGGRSSAEIIDIRKG